MGTFPSNQRQHLVVPLELSGLEQCRSVYLLLSYICLVNMVQPSGDIRE